MPADHPLDPLFRVPQAWTSQRSFYAAVGNLADKELESIGEFLRTSGPLADQPEVVERLKHLGGRLRSDAEVRQMITEFEWSKGQVSWGGSPVTSELERLLAEGADLQATYAVRIVFFAFGDQSEARRRLERDSFEHLLSTWNESGWSGIDGDWVMHVARVQPATEAALRDAVALIRSACVVSDISLRVLTTYEQS